MAKAGRPHKEIDQRAFENLCGIQCTMEEICAYFDITEKTLQSWCKRTYKKHFSQVFREKRRIGNISLRRSQFEMAKKNVTMAIWLGKQYLGQTDTVQVNQDAVLAKLDEVLAGVKEDADGAE